MFTKTSWKFFPCYIFTFMEYTREVLIVQTNCWIVVECVENQVIHSLHFELVCVSVCLCFVHVFEAELVSCALRLLLLPFIICNLYKFFNIYFCYRQLYLTRCCGCVSTFPYGYTGQNNACMCVYTYIYIYQGFSATWGRSSGCFNRSCVTLTQMKINSVKYREVERSWCVIKPC